MAIEIESLHVTRGGNRVLRGVSASIPAGSVTGLLGPSGAGKTTLMRAIVGVQKVASGSVTVLGQPAGSPALRKRVSYLTQAPSIYVDLTVTQNVQYFAALHGLPSSEVGHTIEAVGLAKQARQMVSTLSGGQFSRASLACALVSKPEVLILDEPTVGQDPVLRDELWGRFHDLAQGGATLVVSSHVMDEANRCDQLLLMRDGQIIAADTAQSLKATAGTVDLDQAFLTLVRDHDHQEAS